MDLILEIVKLRNVIFEYLNLLNVQVGYVTVSLQNNMLFGS